MREGNSFSLFICPRRWGRGVSQSGQGGGGGLPWPGQDARSGQGVPEDGVPPDQGWGTLLARDGVTPPHPEIGQQSEYLLRDGRYASCVHAAVLSCGLKFYPKSFSKEIMQKGRQMLIYLLLGCTIIPLATIFSGSPPKSNMASWMGYTPIVIRTPPPFTFNKTLSGLAPVVSPAK